MNTDIKAKWVAALRSGEYAQGSQMLRCGDEMCCLGVLSDLYIKETELGRWIANQTGFNSSFDFSDVSGFREGTELPSAVMIWAEIETAAPFAYTPDGTVDLIDANDKGMPFPKIADIIEAYL